MTGKSLSDRLAEQARKNPQKRGTGRSAFLALKADIADALVAGWQAKEIHALLKGEKKLEISYTVFLRYIKQFITEHNLVQAGQRTAQGEVVASSTPPATPTAKPAIDQKPERPNGPRTFEFTAKGKSDGSK